MSRWQIFKLIHQERGRQDAQWGTIQENPHTLHEWVRIMIDQLLDADDAIQRGSHEEAMREILHATAVGVACMEQEA